MPQINLTFANALRSILRQDPDIIMIGEMRDGETAQIAVQSALTGHLVLSTLHTNTAASAVVRMQDMGVERYLITSTVNGVLAQRLVRRLCPHCKAPGAAGARAAAKLRPGALSGAGQPIYRLWAASTAAAPATRAAPASTNCWWWTSPCAAPSWQGTTPGALHAWPQGGMLTLYEDGLRKVAAGVTSLDELLRVTQDQGDA
jgi:general secretion pathway protein E